MGEIKQSEDLSNGEVIVVQGGQSLPVTVGNMISWLMFGAHFAVVSRLSGCITGRRPACRKTLHLRGRDS